MALDEILTLSKEARFFNVHALADALVQLVPTLGKSRRFQAICRGFDHIVAERCGSQAAAKLALARALRLHENDRPWEAIRELHRAKGAWFHGESIDDCIRAFATLSSLYSQEGLHLAALYYALAGISIANESHSVQS
mgnify:CR=1 FL=1